MFLNKSCLSTVRADLNKPGSFQLTNATGTWVFDWGHALEKEPIGELSGPDKVQEPAAGWLEEAYRDEDHGGTGVTPRSASESLVDQGRGLVTEMNRGTDDVQHYV